MFVMLLVTTLCVLSMFLYRKWVKVKNYWADRGVPFDPPNPLVGNLTFLLRKNPSLWMRELYEKHRTPYVGVWLFWRPALVINSPELARNILVRDAANFRNKFMTASSRDPIGSLNILLTKDPAWTNIRRRLSVAFTLAKLKHVQMVAASKAQDLVTRITNEGDIGISLRTMFSDYTTDVVGTSAFELAGDTTLTGRGALRAVTRHIMGFTVARGLAWCAIFFWPEMAEAFGVNFLPRKSTDTLRHILKVRFNSKEAEVIKEPKTVLEVLMQMRTKCQEDEVYSEDCIMAQATALLVGGFETTSSALTYITYTLAHSPEHQDKLYQELLAAKENHGNNMDAITSDCKYIDCVIKEVLRIFPPMAWLDRVSDQAYEVDEQLTIDAGTPVYVNGVGMQMDPRYHPDPLAFDPDRFAGSIPAYTYMPFGEGPRICIGKRYAIISLRNAIATIILNFKVEPLPNSPKPLEAEIQKTGLFLMPGEDLKVKFIPRQ